MPLARWARKATHYLRSYDIHQKCYGYDTTQKLIKSDSFSYHAEINIIEAWEDTGKLKNYHLCIWNFQEKNSWSTPRDQVQSIERQIKLYNKT